MKKTAPGAPSQAPRIILTLLSLGNDHPIEAKISAGLTAAVRERGYEPVPGVVPIDPRAEVRRLVADYGDRLAGIALQPFRPNRELAELLLTQPIKNIPHIIIGHYFYHMLINACVIDNYGGMYAVTEHMIRLGRRRLAYLGEVSLSSTEHERFQGFAQACLHHGIHVPPHYIVSQYFNLDLRQIIHDLFSAPERPDGLVCLFDGLAHRVLGILKELGIDVPREVSVMSFGDDEDIAERCTPPLTTAHHPAYEMGAVAGHQLINQIEGLLPLRPTLFVLPAGMQIRESCGTPEDALPAGRRQWEIPFSNYAGICVRPADVLSGTPTAE